MCNDDSREQELEKRSWKWCKLEKPGMNFIVLYVYSLLEKSRETATALTLLNMFATSKCKN